MAKFKIPRTKQCAKCPWKTSTNPYDIPNGYCETKHKKLENTIAKEGEFNFGNLKSMACHHSNSSDNMYCIGWLHNQLGIGNNLGLRIRMIDCENINKLKIVGPQHLKFEDTLPKLKTPNL